MAVVARRGVYWLRLLAWALPTLAAMSLALAAVAPVLLTSQPSRAAWGAFDYLLFHSVCHQQPDRCLWIGGAPMALCARCTAIYAGFALIGFVSQFSIRQAPHDRRLRLFLLALALLAADVAGEIVGLRGPFLPTRLLTGALAGAAGAWLIIPALRFTESPDLAVGSSTDSGNAVHRTRIHHQGGGIHVTH